MLKATCENFILQQMTIETVLDTLVVADLCSSLKLKDYAVEYIFENASAVMELETWEDFAQKHSKLNTIIFKKMAAEQKNIFKRFKK